jgi:hypothetical protein
MKILGYRPPQRFDRAAENTSAPSQRSRSRASGVLAMMLVVLILACAEREILGASHGSLTSMVSGSVVGALHHLMATLVPSESGPHGPLRMSMPWPSAQFALRK